MSLRYYFSMLFILMAFSACASLQGVSSIQAIDLHTDRGSVYSAAYDINNKGQIVGEKGSSANHGTAFIYEKSTGMVALELLPGGTFSVARGINAYGDVVGVADLINGTTGDLVHHGFVRHNGRVMDLGAYPPEDDINSLSAAYAINDRGQIAGSVDLAGVVWDLYGTPEYPPFPPNTVIRFDGDFRPAIAYDINAAGLAAGTEYSTEIAFYTILATTRIYKIVGVAENRAYGIDGIGRAAGSATFRSNNEFKTHAIYWVGTTLATDLGTLGGANSVAMDLNSHQLVVGYSDDGKGHTVAFVWHPNFGMHALGTLGGKNSKAYGINADGQIVGSSETISGATHATLWKVTYIQSMK